MTNKEEGELIQSFLNEEVTIEELIKQVSDSALDEGYESGFGEGCREMKSAIYSYVDDIEYHLSALKERVR